MATLASTRWNEASRPPGKTRTQPIGKSSLAHFSALFSMCTMVFARVEPAYLAVPVEQSRDDEMIMNPFSTLLIAAIVMFTGCSSYRFPQGKSPALAAYESEKAAIYAHMKRYGVNRENVAAMGRLVATTPPYLYPRVNLIAENLLNPGEHYRAEMDDLVLTMKVPDLPASGSWIWPYTNLRHPDEATLIDLKDYDGQGVQLAALGWYTCHGSRGHLRNHSA
jgi:hypothetical protein